MKRTKFNWLSFYEIHVVSARAGEHIKLGSGSDYIMPEIWGQSLKRINKDGSVYFFIIFNSDKPPVFELIAHECWHMFFQILEFQGEKELGPEEMMKELYAMSFETLIHGVMKALCALGVYKEAE